MIKILIQIYIEIVASYKKTLLSYVRVLSYILQYFFKTQYIWKLFSIIYKSIKNFTQNNVYLKKLFLGLKLCLKILIHFRYFVVLNVTSCYIQLLFCSLIFDLSSNPIMHIYFRFFQINSNIIVNSVLFLIMIFIMINELKLYPISQLASPALSVLATIISYSTLKNLFLIQNTIFTINDIY